MNGQDHSPSYDITHEDNQLLLIHDGRDHMNRQDPSSSHDIKKIIPEYLLFIHNQWDHMNKQDPPSPNGTYLL